MPPGRTGARAAIAAIAASGGLAAAGCAARAARPVAPAGVLAGIIRAADTGAPIAGATLVLQRPGALALAGGRTGDDGAYAIDRLAPGAYGVRVFRDGRLLAAQAITVAPGGLTGLDLAIAPPASATRDGAADRASEPAASLGTGVDVAGAGPLWRYRPIGGDPGFGAIEGTVCEEGGRTRLGGTVITIADRAGALVADAVTDDDGRYRVEPVPPGAYVVSAYYTLVGRGQVEIRRSDVVVDGGDVVVVPLAIETDGS
jgi:hypothetical protein